MTWFFEPGALFLDFVYTGDLGTNDPWWEKLNDPASLDRWLGVHVSTLLLRASPTDLRAARTLRSTLVTITFAIAHREAAPDEAYRSLVAAAGRPDVPPNLPGFPRLPVPAKRGLATIARDAVGHLAAPRDRLRVCAASDCPLVFLDTSRSGNRAWCSMARCGNRTKARKFQQRSRLNSTEDNDG